MNRGEGRRALAGALLLAALLPALPFISGVFRGRSLYFRDLSRYYFPWRLHVLEGLKRGELRFWNPLVHEGQLETLLPIAYPFDLLQLLWPDERGLTLLVLLHLPLSAVGLLMLAYRGLGVRPLAALGGAIVYALGGFALSTVNFYAYVQVLAWAPFVALAALEVGRRPDRGPLLLTALASGVVASTGQVEMVAQTFLLAVTLLLASSGERLRLRWAFLGLLAGIALASPVLFVMAGAVRGSQRAQGFPTEVVLAHSIHPVTFLQTLVGSLHGDVGNLVGRFWGSEFASGGFPYFLSYYLGALSLALALGGARWGGASVRALLVLGLLAGWLCLGTWGGLRPLLEGVPWLRGLRFPSKAFFTVHFVCALLCSLGLEALLGGEDQRWRRLGRVLLALGGLLVSGLLVFELASLPAIPGLFSSNYSADAKRILSRFVLEDAATGGALALVAGSLAVLVAARRLSGQRAVVALVTLLAVDLVRTGAGLNPMVTQDFYRPSRDVEAAAKRHLQGDARVYTCSVESSRSYREELPLYQEGRDAFGFSALGETLTPSFNLKLGVRTALSLDLTQQLPLERAFPDTDLRCDRVAGVLSRIRAAAVTHVLSVDALPVPGLELLEVLEPSRIAPLRVYLYALRRPLARLAFEDAAAGEAAPDRGIVLRHESNGRLEVSVEAGHPGRLVVRDSWAPGWTARLDGAPLPILREGAYRAVSVPAGRHKVEFAYSPPGLQGGLAVAGLGGLLLAIALFRLRRRSTTAA